MSNAPTILVVTGTRADFGLWLPVLEAAHQAGIQPRLLVTAMHLEERFGRTVDEVRASGYHIAAEVRCTAADDTRSAMSVSLGRAIDGVTPVIDREAPHAIGVLGDRGEQLAAALAALHLGVPVIHLHGGERTFGAVDDTIRDLISRIAALHLVATRDARDRLGQLGIPPEAVSMTGAPGLDAIARRPTRNDASIRERYGVGDTPYLVLVQHPETVGNEDPVGQLRATLAAIRSVGLPTVAILPNADAGGRAMGDFLSASAGMLLRTHASVPHVDYLALLAGASALVGNSSSGIIEAPMLRVPAVNIGDRQAGRTRGDNVIDVEAERAAIERGIEIALSQDFRDGLSGHSPYGDGRAAGRIADRILGFLRNGEP